MYTQRKITCIWKTKPKFRNLYLCSFLLVLPLLACQSLSLSLSLLGRGEEKKMNQMKEAPPFGYFIIASLANFYFHLIDWTYFMVKICQTHLIHFSFHLSICFFLGSINQMYFNQLKFVSPIEVFMTYSVHIFSHLAAHMAFWIPVQSIKIKLQLIKVSQKYII